MAMTPGGLSKAEVVTRLRQAGDMLRLRNESPYRARAYETAADELDANPEDLGRLIAEGRLRGIRGIGPSLAVTIADLFQSGRAASLDQIMGSLPPGLLEVARLPGLTQRRVQKLYDALGIASLADLRAALDSGAVVALDGFGERTVARLRAALGEGQGNGDGGAAGENPAKAQPRLFLLAEALPLAAGLLAHLRVGVSEHASAIVGSIRRAVDLVESIELVAGAANPDDVIKTFQDHPSIASNTFARHAPTTEGETCRMRLGNGIPVLLTVTRPDRFALAIVRLTGSDAHVAKLQARARARGVNLDDHVGADEAELYQRLRLPFIPPELREDAGELESADAGDDFGDLIRMEDLRGVVHCHTTYSDGRNTVMEMARAGVAMGMSYLTITDHSPRAVYAHGVGTDRLAAQWREIAAAEADTGITLLRGTESDILEDGSLDYPSEVLDAFQVVIASVHERHRMNSQAMTERFVRAMQQPIFKIWGHPLGRLLLRRDPVACDVERVLDAAARTATAIEINGSPHRLDLPAHLIPAARRRGLKFVISADAHSTDELHSIAFGVTQARRGGVRRGEVLNTEDAGKFAALVAPSSRGGRV